MSKDSKDKLVFREFVTFKIYINQSTKEIKAGFTPTMKIKHFKESSILKDNVPQEFHSSLFFFLNDKLDDEKTFKELGIKNNQIIDVYASKFYLYKYNDKMCPISADIQFNNLIKVLKKHFDLLPDNFFIDQNGKILTEKNYKHRSNMELPNGTIFELKIPIKMHFRVNEKYDITANSDQQVKVVIQILSSKIHMPPEKILLLNNADKIMRSDSYLYSFFKIVEKDRIYKIQAREGKNLVFQLQSGKFLNEYFLPSMTIDQIIDDLKNTGRKIENNSFIIYMGKIFKGSDTLENVLFNINDDDDDFLLIIEDKVPFQIIINLNFQLDKEVENKIFQLVNPTEVLNVRYWASFYSGQNFNSILLNANDHILEDDEILKEDTKITVSLISNQYKQSQDYFIGNEEEAFHQVLSKIGEGDFSVSFKIYDSKQDKLMCKKILKIIKNNETRNKVLQRTMKEFDALQKLDHPGICKLIGINISEPAIESEKDSKSDEEITTIALFYEFLDYSLSDFLKIMNNTLKTKIVIEIAHAMNFIHKNGFIHRDLRIDNIRFNSIFEAKIIDFGLIRIHESLNKDFSYVDVTMTKRVGSFNYMSPEMKNEEEYDYKTDVYSFGIVLYVIFVGSLPKKGGDKAIKMPNESPSISKTCISIISKCLLHEKSKRPSFEQILQEIRKNSYSLASYVDKEIVAERDQQLQNLNK